MGHKGDLPKHVSLEGTAAEGSRSEPKHTENFLGKMRIQPHHSHDEAAHRSKQEGEASYLLRRSHSAPACGGSKVPQGRAKGEATLGRVLSGREGEGGSSSSCPHQRSGMGLGAGGEAYLCCGRAASHALGEQHGHD